MIKIHEPMLKHYICIHIGEQGRKEYCKITGDESGGDRDGSTYTEPIQHCFHVWVNNKDNFATLVHEFYHLTSIVRERMSIDEEASAYYIGYLVREYFKYYDKKLKGMN